MPNTIRKTCHGWVAETEKGVRYAGPSWDRATVVKAKNLDAPAKPPAVKPPPVDTDPVPPKPKRKRKAKASE